MKDIVQEEIALMKKLFKTKGGFLISEQSKSPEQEIYDLLKAGNIGFAGGVAGTNIEKLKQGFGKFTDAKQLLAVEKMMSEKPIGTYKTIADLLKGELEQDNQKDFVELQKLVEPKGITLTATTQKTASGLPFLNLQTIKVTSGNPATLQQQQKGNDRQTNVNNTFCSVKGGIIINPSSRNNNVKWVDFVKVYKVNDQEIKTAKNTCPNSELAKTYKNTSGSGQQNVSQRFSKSLSSAGIQNGKMDVQTLQTIINTLEGGQSNQLTSSQSQPDLAQLTAAINQLG
jgi:hypothetical protein